MLLEFQQDALSYLKSLADNDIHSVCISGISGSGKTYLAHEFAKMKHIDTFQIVSHKVDDLKSALYASYSSEDRQVVCIENLDSGTSAASQVILKYLEEPKSNVYVIVTCCNAAKLPSTIRSRSVSVGLKPPAEQDLWKYAESIVSNRSVSSYLKNSDSGLFTSICKSLDAVKLLNSMKLEDLQHYESFTSREFWNKTPDQIIWSLGHFADGSAIDLSISLRLLYKAFDYDRSVLDAMLDLESGKLSSTAVLGNLVLKLKFS